MKKQSQGFNKFIKQEEKGSQKKERIRQEKKAARKETQAYFEKKKEEAKQARATGNNTSNKWGSRGNEGAHRQNKNTDENKAFNGKKKFSRSEDNKEGSRPAARKGFKKSSGLGPRAFKKAGGYKKLGRTPRSNSGGFDKPQKGFSKREEGNEENGGPASRFKNSRFSRTENKPVFKKNTEVKREPKAGAAKSFASRITEAGPVPPKSASARTEKPAPKIQKAVTGKKPAIEKEEPANPVVVNTGSMPLNKFIAHAGVCSRRDAADIVKSGKVVVNGETVTEPGFKVSGKDDIKVNGKKIAVRKNLVYILLNKPKDFITTTDDPQGRKTVLDIVRNATTERVYPIGRLDRNTTGVLLLTNDGELAQKLSHPSYEVKKIYEVTLDKPLTKKDFDSIMSGVTLEDGFVQPDALAYADSKDKSIVGIEIHSGRNRIVRRIFEHMGYDVRNLDRVMYANLTKKNVDRGKWRLLTEKEVRLLKFLNASYTNKNKPASRG